jgi:hypothetical protein
MAATSLVVTSIVAAITASSAVTADAVYDCAVKNEELKLLKKGKLRPNVVVSPVVFMTETDPVGSCGDPQPSGRAAA